MLEGFNPANVDLDFYVLHLSRQDGILAKSIILNRWEQFGPAIIWAAEHPIPSTTIHFDSDYRCKSDTWLREKKEEFEQELEGCRTNMKEYITIRKKRPITPGECIEAEVKIISSFVSAWIFSTHIKTLYQELSNRNYYEVD